MAGLCGLKILLLLAGLTGLANCSDATSTDQPVCSYTVLPEKFGFRITISHNYAINLTKPHSTINVTLTEADSTISHNYTQTLSGHVSKNVPFKSSTISHHVYLKPYTRYRHNVIGSTARQCQLSGNKTTLTSKIEQNDIELVQCNTSGRLCYRSYWDMSSVSIGNDTQDKLQSCTGDKNHQNVFCSNNTFNLNYSNICSNVSVNLSFSTNYTFSLTQYITPDFLNSLKSQIKLKPPDRLPAEIQWTNKPPKCNNDTYAIESTCQEHNKLSELKPYTNYNCTVTIKYNNSTIVKTVPVPRIDCEVNITSQVVKTTSHSFEISFKAISKKCPDFNFTSLFSYNCNYTKGKHNETMEHEHKCEWLDLKPNTRYGWKVEAIYKNITVGITEGQTLTTEDLPVCSYTVQPEKFGFRIIAISHNYAINPTKPHSTINVTLTEADSTISHNYTETLSGHVSKNVTFNSSTISHHVYLKPYTRYRHNVISSTARQCQLSGNKTTLTSKIEQNDIELVQCNTSGRLCYRSYWDMSSVSIGNDTLDKLQSCTGDKNHQNVFCSNNTFNLNYNDICSNVSVNISFSTNYTFSLTQYITSDFINSLKSQITLKPPDRFPAKIQWTNKPPKCNNDTYAINANESTCQEHNKSRKLSELEPYTNYNCTVTIKSNNSTIVKTVPVPSIDCKVNITSQVVKTTSHSFEISFKAISKKCPDFTQSLFSYNCNYTKGKHNETMEHEHKCEWLYLKPNTRYDWKVEAIYKNNTVGITEGQTLTAEGHNNKVLTGLLVFFIILTSVAMLFYVYKIYCRRRWNSHELVQRMELHQYLLIPGEDEAL